MTRQKLRGWLREQKMTQRALAEHLNVHFTTVNRWVSGKPVAQGKHKGKPLDIPKWLPLVLEQLEGRQR